MKDRLKKLFVLCATLFNIYSLQALEKDQLNAFKIDPTSISESEYVVVKDGHLSVNGKRQRYWAAVGKVYGNADVKEGDNPEQVQQKVKLSRKSTDIILNRLQEMGFNSVRLWDGFIDVNLSLIHISEPTRLGMISYAVFCLKKKKKKKK